MAKRKLTAGAMEKLKAGADRLEIHDAGTPGLHAVGPSTQRSGPANLGSARP